MAVTCIDTALGADLTHPRDGASTLDGMSSHRRSSRHRLTRVTASIAGWAMACAFVTAITLSAVEHARNEVSSSPPVTSEAGVAAQASKAEAAARSASAVPAPAPSASASAHRTGAPATPRPAATPTLAPSNTATPVTGSTTTSLPTLSPLPTTNPSPSLKPTASARTSKQAFLLPDEQISYAMVSVVCVENDVYQPSGDGGTNYRNIVFLYPPDAATGYGYVSDTIKFVTTAQGVKLDVTFTDTANATHEFLFGCRAGQAYEAAVSPASEVTPTP